MVMGTGTGAGAVGVVVAGARLSALVGRGATGEVWAGTDVEDGSRVAVKLVHDASADVEAVLLDGLRHPHVLGVRRVCHDPPAVVTDLAGGGSLAAQVRARGCLRPAEVVTVVAPLADALAWLHGRGVVHGDVSATNVLFVGRGRPVLADLGAASLAGEGTVVATPGFAAPEVVGGAPAGPPADVHGLGALAWLALTGSVPPSAEDRLPLRLLVPECPDALVEAVGRALDPDPAGRPSPLELAAEVRAACRGEPVRLVPSAALGVRADEAVTYRVREAAARDGEGRRAIGRRLPGLRLPRLRLPSRPTPWPLRPAQLVVAVLVAVVTVVVLGATAVVPALRADDDQAQSQAVAPTPSPPSADDGHGAVAAGTPGTGRGSEPRPGDGGLAPVVARLVEARGEALRAGDADALARVHHPDGTTLAPDRALVATGPVQVHYQVLSVRPLEEQVVAVDVLTTVAGTGPVRESVVVELARDDGRWLVLSVSG